MRTALLMIVLLSTASAATAQSARDDHVETVLRPGMTVWITDSSGREEKIRIDSNTAGVVMATSDGQVRRLRTADVVRVRARQSDSLLDGALIGAGAAIASGLLMCNLTEPWENCRDDVGPILRIGALGAGVGIGIDALIRGRKTIYEGAQGTRLHAAPILASRTKGLRIVLNF